jgi:membrane associated rhomboid family serine protease
MLGAMSAPELSVVCRNCGSEVSPYVTECPYCGQRLRKRAPKLQREGDEIKVREGRRERRLRKDAERRTRAEARLRGEGGGGRFEELATKPVATGLLLVAFTVMFVLYRASNLSPTDLGVIFGTPEGEPWRYLTAPFFFDDAGYLFACGLAIAIFLPPIERRIGSVAALILALACGALGMLGGVIISDQLSNGIPLAAGANGIALGVLAAYVVIREPERRADPEESYDPIAVGIAAAVLLALPLVEDFADPWVGLCSAVVGALCGLTANMGRRSGSNA